jgi:uncharacterized membrane protein YhaH (DUF805 family)
VSGLSLLRRFADAATPNLGYGLTVFGTLFLGNVGVLLATTPRLEQIALGHLAHVLAFAILGGLAVIFTGLNIAHRRPLTDRAPMLWVWLLGFPASRRLAEIALAVKWDPEMALEAALLAAAALIVLLGAVRPAPERAP